MTALIRTTFDGATRLCLNRPKRAVLSFTDDAERIIRGGFLYSRVFRAMPRTGRALHAESSLKWRWH